MRDTHSERICRGFVGIPMKGTTFGCINLPHITASLKNDYRAQKPRSWFDTIKTCQTGYEPFQGSVIVQGNPQVPNRNSIAVMGTFPYSEGTTKGRLDYHFEDFTHIPSLIISFPLTFPPYSYEILFFFLSGIAARPFESILIIVYMFSSSICLVYAYFSL